MHALRLYGRLIAASARGQLSYRLSFVLNSFGVFMLTAIEFLGIWALFARFGQVRGWTLPEVALFYGMISVTWAFIDATTRGFDVLGSMVSSGEFDRMLVRPRSTLLQLLGYELTLRRVGRLVQGIVVLVYAGMSIAWTIERAFMLVAAIACGMCAFFGLMIFEATSVFWTIESLEVWNAFTYGGITMSQYPVAIYRGWFRGLFTYGIPLACINYYPGLVILGHPDPLGAPLYLQWLAPLAGPLFLLASMTVWRIGVRHYRSSGS